jgi:ABC-type amino acid transport substrate-binding protein
MYLARFRLFLFASGCLASGGQALSQVEPIHLAGFPKSAYQYVSAQILTDVYQKSGMGVKIELMPPPRATKEALAGRVDGEVSRVKSHGDDNPALIRVTPAYTYFTMTAFSRLAVSIESPADLKKYRVGVVRGLQASADITEGLDNVEMAVNS